MASTVENKTKNAKNTSADSSRTVSPHSRSPSSSHTTTEHGDHWSVSSRRSPRRNKELTAVSKLVKKKLEDYMNKEKREIKFDPDGYYRTTKRMYKYDLAYKLLEATKMEKRKKSSNRESSETSSTSISAITPRLHPNTYRDGITLVREAERLSASANDIFQSLPVDKLAAIHGYRRDPKVAKTVETGKVHNYTRHVGAALHTDAYVEYYKKAGLGGHTRSQSRSDNEDEDDRTNANQRKNRISKTSRFDVHHGAYTNDASIHNKKAHKTSKCSNKKQNAQGNSSKAHDNGRNTENRSRSPTKRPKTSKRRVAKKIEEEYNFSSEEESSDSSEEDANNSEEEKAAEEGNASNADEEKANKSEEEKAHDSAEEKKEPPEKATESPVKKPSTNKPKKARKNSKSRKSKKKDRVKSAKNENEEYSDDFESGNDSTDSDDEFNGNSYKALRAARRRKRPKTGYKNRSKMKSPRNGTKDNQLQHEDVDKDSKGEDGSHHGGRKLAIPIL